MAGKTKGGGLPFMGGVGEGIDLVKKVWGVTGLPGLPTPSSMAQFAQRLPQTLPSMIAPTLDVEELDKRITDLRAVEQWLNLNMSMLRTTVQSLEVQRNTIATLKSFGGAMLATSQQQAPQAAATTASWPYAVAPAAPATAGMIPEPTPAAAPRKRRPGKASATGATLPLNPAVWWGTLQDQFNKIAIAAAAEAAAAAKASAASKATAAAKTTTTSRKAASKATAKGSTRKRRRS